VKTKNGAIEDRRHSQSRPRGSRWSHGGPLDQQSQITSLLVRKQEQDQDPDTHQREKMDRIYILRGIRIRINVMRSASRLANIHCSAERKFNWDKSSMTNDVGKDSLFKSKKMGLF
jgi:hypothetical protein